MEIKLSKKDEKEIANQLLEQLQNGINNLFEQDYHYELLDEIIKNTGVFKNLGEKISVKIGEKIDEMLDNKEFMESIAREIIKDKLK